MNAARAIAGAQLPGHRPPALVRAEPALFVTDYAFLGGLCLALFLVADPLDLRFGLVALAKHLPFAICSVAAIGVISGALLYPARSGVVPRREDWPVLRACFPLVVLGVWVVMASAYARWHEGIRETFLVVGWYMLFAAVAAKVVLESPARMRIVRAYIAAAAVAAVYMVLRSFYEFRPPSLGFHEMEALVIPLAVYFALRRTRSAFLRWAPTFFFLASAFVFWKNTAFLVLAITLLYLAWALLRSPSAGRRPPSGTRPPNLWLLPVVLALGLAAAAAGVLAGLIPSEILPSGNPEYRLRTYESLWYRFTQSPLVGTGFIAQGVEKFTAYHIPLSGGILPSHSDLLDLLANGGVLAIALLVAGYARIVALVCRHALARTAPEEHAPTAHALACMAIASIVVYGFNPVLLQPHKALLLWTSVGMLVGLALYIRRGGERHMERGR
jgi:hypothetical protein